MRRAAFHSVFGPGFVIFPIAEEGLVELDIDGVVSDCKNDLLARIARERCVPTYRRRCNQETLPRASGKCGRLSFSICMECH